MRVIGLMSGTSADGIDAALAEMGVNIDVDKLQDTEDAMRRGVTTQPALFINGRRVEHPTDLATVVNAIDRALRDITRN